MWSKLLLYYIVPELNKVNFEREIENKRNDVKFALKIMNYLKLSYS